MNILPGAAWLITARVSRRFFRLQNIERIQMSRNMQLLPSYSNHKGEKAVMEGGGGVTDPEIWLLRTRQVASFSCFTELNCCSRRVYSWRTVWLGGYRLDSY